MTLDQVHDEIVKLGARPIGRYYQLARTEKIANATVRGQMEGGFCGGVCLDWIRRNLLGGKSTLADDARRDLRAAHGQTQLSYNKLPLLQQVRDKINAKALQHQAEFDPKYDALLAKLNQEFDRLNRLAGIKQQELDALGAKAQALYDKEVGELEASAAELDQNLAAAKKKWEDKPEMEKLWQPFAAVMDQYLKEDRIARKKVGPSRRGFDRLKVVRAIDRKLFNGLLPFITDAAGKNLAANHAAMLDVGPPNREDQSHSTAIIRQNAGTYMFFDPNLGIYTFPLAASLQSAFVYLFKTAYPAVSVVLGDAHPYEVNGKISGSYTIFEGKQAPVLAVNQVSV